jgi:putative hydrolase of the HAD superfamily
MMTPVEIRAVIFDLGGTLEDVYYDDDLRLKATPGFREILAKHDLDPGLSIPDLYAVITAGMKKYGAWREKTEQEMPPEQVWNEFVFTNQGWPQEKLAAIGEELAFYWDTRFSHRVLRPESPAVLHDLRERCFRLGVISNILSRGMVPFKLDEYGLTRYFQVVLASASFGWRKPNPHIFLEATRLLDLPPAACAYVGDTVSRDVIGSRRAGYGLVIQIKSFLTGMADKASITEQPDAVVQNLLEVVDLVTLSAEQGK